MTAIHRTAVIGAGTMGHGLALVFARNGLPTRLADLDEAVLQTAKHRIAAALETLAAEGMTAPEEIPAVLSRIHTTTRLEEACAEADFILEAVVEQVEVKRRLFADLDRLAPPHAILASNTSHLDLFSFVETGRPAKVLITHWFSPPHLIPLVEVVGGPQTSAATIAAVRELLSALGKKPLVLRRFLPGFLANRLQAALTQEALFLLENGYATAEELDEAVKQSFALRTPFLGVIQRLDFAGLDLQQAILKNRRYAPPAPIERASSVDARVARGRLGVKTGAGFYDYGGRSPEEIFRARDRRLIRLLRLLEETGPI